MEKKLRSMTVSSDEEVSMKFIEEVFVSGVDSGDDGEEDVVDSTSVNKYSVDSANKPHKDFWDCLTKLKKHGLDVCEIKAEGKELGTWAVTGIKIAGDVVMKKGRVQLRVSKLVKRSKKTIHLWSPQVTMFPDNEDMTKYENANKLTECVEALIDECWAYLHGKYEQAGQFPLFTDKELVA